MLHVMATGTGKTVVFSKLYEAMKSRLPGQMLVIAHTEELVKQNQDKIQAVNPTLKVDREMAGTYADPNADIISASVQTLGRDGSKRPDRFNWPNIDKIVIDEAHHSTSDGYRRILDRAGVLQSDSSKLLLGVTATPTRPDGSSLSDLFDKVVYSYGMREAIKDGWLVDIRGFRVATDTRLDGVSKVGGDFVKSELSSAVNTDQRNTEILKAWKSHGENRQTIAFTVDIAHAKKLAEAFQEAGVAAEAIWGDDPDRDEKLRRHREGEIKVLCNCAVLTEGYDDWRIGCVILARPTASGILFTQMVGRGTRLDPDYGNLKSPDHPEPPKKTDCVVLDVVDGSAGHSLITLPTLMGLKNVLDLKGKSLLWAVETLEKLQAENPSVNFDKLTDIDSAKVLIESVDMFQVRFPAEVEANSQLTWFRAIDGGYKMLIPKETDKPGAVRIFENALGRWQISGEINDETFHGTRPTMEECFKVADEQIRKRVSPMTLSCVKREATWHKNKVTDGQKKMLGRLFPHKKFDFSLMNSGDASRVIAERLSKKA
jgi:superfamily II DNA or RNA helicase